MVIEEKFTIKSPLKESWEFLLNPETLGPCIPGCEKIEATSDREYDSVIAAKVGPIAVRFRVKTVIDEIKPYSPIRTVGEGKELRNLGSFKQKTSTLLNELSENETEVTYRSEVSVVGRIATFGDRVLKHKANEIGKQFAEQVNTRISITDEPADQPDAEPKKISLMSKIMEILNKIKQFLTRSKP